jgi:hypothetical protein
LTEFITDDHFQRNGLRVEPNQSPSENEQNWDAPTSESEVERPSANRTPSTNDEPAVTAIDGSVALTDAASDTEAAPPRRIMRAEEYRQLLDKKIRRMYPWSAFLFVGACASTWFVGGPVYAICVMGILLAHELGHYIQALRYHVPASPPMFIPMPILPLGTMGAVILQGAGFANRKALFDIAITGPLAGLVFAIPVAWWGIQHSTVMIIDPSQATQIFGNPLILEWMIEAQHGALAQNQDIALTPLLFAGWVGIFITALNLIPIGQLDGGHILYTLIGRKAHWVARGVVVGAIAWMIFNQDPSYILMIFLLLAFGLKHPPSADDTATIGPIRTILGWLTLAFVLIGFTPFPLTVREPEAPSVAPQQTIPTVTEPSIIPMHDPAEPHNAARLSKKTKIAD